MDINNIGHPRAAGQGTDVVRLLAVGTSDTDA